MKKDTTPAFPCPTGTDGGALQTGMTLRDWFAGQVIGHLEDPSGESEAKDFAKCAYMIADAMMKERAK